MEPLSQISANPQSGSSPFITGNCSTKTARKLKVQPLPEISATPVHAELQEEDETVRTSEDKARRIGQKKANKPKEKTRQHNTKQEEQDETDTRRHNEQDYTN